MTAGRGHTDPAAEAFLTHEEVKRLTGRNRRALQIEHLRAAGIPFYVDALGWPVVARVHVFGKQAAAAPAPARPKWTPAVLSSPTGHRADPHPVKKKSR